MFICDKCGLCCKHLPNIDLVHSIRKDDGQCIFLSEEGLCTIYNQRPVFCRVDEGYNLLQDRFSLQEYYEINYKICQKLKEMYL